MRRREFLSIVGLSGVTLSTIFPPPDLSLATIVSLVGLCVVVAVSGRSR